MIYCKFCKKSKVLWILTRYCFNSYKFLDFYQQASNGAVKNKKLSNQQFTEEFHKPIIIKFEKQKV